MFMGNSRLTLEVTAQRIINGTQPVIAIKEHIDEWNRSLDAHIYASEPPLTGVAHLDAWLAGAAEYEAFMIDQECPPWAKLPCRFLSEPFVISGRNSQSIALVETPFAFRRRLVFSGKTFIRGTDEAGAQT